MRNTKKSLQTRYGAWGKVCFNLEREKKIKRKYIRTKRGRKKKLYFVCGNAPLLGIILYEEYKTKGWRGQLSVSVFFEYFAPNEKFIVPFAATENGLVCFLFLLFLLSIFTKKSF